MSIDQSGSNNFQHIGDVVHNYFFGTKKRNSTELPLRICRIETLKSKFITILPYMILMAFMSYYILHFKEHMISNREFLVILFSAPVLSYFISYILPMFMPKLLISLHQNMIVLDNKKIMFSDIYKINKLDDKTIKLYKIDGEDIVLHFATKECVSHVYDYYRLCRI